MGHLKPLNIFLRQEIDRMQKVISIVRVTLKDLILAIEGTIIMNEVRSRSLNILLAFIIYSKLHFTYYNKCNLLF